MKETELLTILGRLKQLEEQVDYWKKAHLTLQQDVINIETKLKFKFWQQENPEEGIREYLLSLGDFKDVDFEQRPTPIIKDDAAKRFHKEYNNKKGSDEHEKFIDSCLELVKEHKKRFKGNEFRLVVEKNDN